MCLPFGLADTNHILPAAGVNTVTVRHARSRNVRKDTDSLMMAQDFLLTYNGR